MNTHTHLSKHTADEVAKELRAVGWKTEVVRVGDKYEVRYFDRSEHHRKDEQ
jgi:hypothetical protein